MSTFKDIIDTISSVHGELTNQILTSRTNQSVSKMAQEGVANFPVLVSDALTIEDATLVSKALEKEYASFLLVAMTMNPVLSTDGSNASASQYVNKFHQNIDTKATGSDLLNAMSTFTEAAMNKFDLDYQTVEEMQTAMLYYLFENVDCKSINEMNAKYSYVVKDIAESTILNDISNRRIDLTYKPIFEARNDRNSLGPGHTVHRNNTGSSSSGNSPRVYRVNNNGYKPKESKPNTTNPQLNGALTLQMSNDMRRNLGEDKLTSNMISAMSTRQTQHMMDNDVKKANELVPTLLHMRMFRVNKETGDVLPIDFVLGIKATLHPIPSEQMITNVCRGIKNEDTFFNFLRWTTGETRFFKDFVFAINELKIDAINSSNRSSKWWSMLKRRKALSKIKNIILPNKMLPNATLVVTQEEVDTIREVYGYDLTKASILNKLMSNYFLLGFVIVDPSLQRVKFLFDGQSQFETLTYATLARESSTNDKQFKEMLNMLGRRF